MNIILLNGQVLVIIFSLILRHDFLIKDNKWVCGALYLNPLAKFKHCYTPLWKWKPRTKIISLNAVILNKVELNSINDVPIATRASNKVSVDSIRLGDVYVCDDAHDEMLEIIFLGKS